LYNGLPGLFQAIPVRCTHTAAYEIANIWKYSATELRKTPIDYLESVSNKRSLRYWGPGRPTPVVGYNPLDCKHRQTLRGAISRKATKRHQIEQGGRPSVEV